MRVKLETLQKVVKQAVDEDRAVEQLREEVTRVLGVAVVTEGKVEQLAGAANDQIDILEGTGRASRLSFDAKLMSRFTQHRHPEVRRLAARTVSHQLLSSMSSDKDAAVRSAVARRMTAGAVKEMLKKFPSDDGLRVIYRRKTIAEAGIAQPKVDKEPFDMNGKKMGDTVKQQHGPELSEQWYRDKAFKFLQDYGGNIEYSWEEILTRRYVSSMRATNGVEIDEAKLLKAIKTIISEREDAVIDRDALKETLGYLKVTAEREMMSEAAMPIISEEIDPVQALFESNASPQDYVTTANVLFKVQEADIPSAIKKHRLGEQNNRSEKIPVIAYLPHNAGFRSIDERALDRYCESWNTRQSHRGEPLVLEWSGHPGAIGKVSFNVTLK